MTGTTNNVVDFTERRAEQRILEQIDQLTKDGIMTEFERGFMAALCCAYLVAFGPRDPATLDPRYTRGTRLALQDVPHPHVDYMLHDFGDDCA